MKRLLAFALTFLMITISFPVKALAAQTENDVVQLKDSVIDVVFLLKEVFNDRYLMAEEEIKELIRENGYDYSLTMDSFYDQESPFKDADYIRYLAAYMSCKKYAQENGIDILQLREIPFLKYDMTEQIMTEYVPTKIPHYCQSDQVLDEYILNGYEYILSPAEVDVYEQQKNGHYKKTGEKELIIPDEKSVSYMEIKLNIISPDDIFEETGIDKELVDDDYERRTDILRCVTDNQSIAQTVFISLPSISTDSDEVLSEYAAYIEQAEGIRKVIVQTALSLVDKVPYEWGGKATHPGYDTIWWSYNEENGLQHGLDCSGFVQWTYMTSGFPKEIYEKMQSTSLIKASDLHQITKDELKPGDIGVTNRLGTNHTGIYIGEGLWCHCSSDKKTVTVSRYGSFSVYYSPVDDTENIDETVISDYALGECLDDTFINSYNITNNIDTEKSLYYTHNYSYEDEVLLAKFISLKAKGEGMNCWIAVGEVMKNRVPSDMFPDDLYSVIEQNADMTKLQDEEVTDEILNVAHMVLTGQLKVLDNDRAVFFVDIRDLESDEENASDDDSSAWDTYPWFTTINNYVFYSL